MSDKIVTISDANFQVTIIDADGPVLLDFWSERCGPCKTIAPLLEELADEYAGKLTIAKINIDDNPKVPAQYGVRSVPMLTIFNRGKVEANKVGSLSRSQLTSFIDCVI